MKLTRSEFLASVGTAVVGLVAPSALAAPPEVRGPKAGLNLATFERLTGESFRTSGGRVLVLEPISRKWMDRDAVQFSLTFRYDEGVALPQDTYRLSHPDVGGFDVLMIPAGKDAQGRTFLRADFNQLR